MVQAQNAITAPRPNRIVGHDHKCGPLLFGHIQHQIKYAIGGFGIQIAGGFVR